VKRSDETLFEFASCARSFDLAGRNGIITWSCRKRETEQVFYPFSLALIYHSQLSMESKLLLYKAILKSIWTCGVQLWGTAANSNVEIIQRFQNKYLRIIVNAPWYVNNTLHHDLNVPYARDEIKKLSQRYADRLEKHPNARDAETPRGSKRKLKTYVYKV